MTEIIAKLVDPSINSLLLNEIAALKEKIFELEARQDAFARKIYSTQTQPLQRVQGSRLIDLVRSNGGSIEYKFACQKMGMQKSAFSKLVKAHSEHIVCQVAKTDRRRKVLITI